MSTMPAEGNELERIEISTWACSACRIDRGDSHKYVGFMYGDKVM